MSTAVANVIMAKINLAIAFSSSTKRAR